MKKSKKRRYRSDAFAAIHETAKAMYRVGRYQQDDDA